METVHRFGGIDQARNAAVRWLEGLGAVLGPHRTVVLGKFNQLAGRETGVESTHAPYWRLRLDYDPVKQAHYNAEFGKGAQRQKAVFLFPGGADLIARIALRRAPR
jgi:hypothetical protein